MVTDEAIDMAKVEATETIRTSTNSRLAPSDVLKGENKIPVKKSGRKRKHGLRNAKKEVKQQTEKRRPRYFCQF